MARLLASTALSVLLVAAIPGALTTPVASTTSSPVPCADPRGCPDMTIDIAQMFVGSQEDVFVEEGSCLITEGYLAGPGSHHIVRLNLGGPNVGQGDLILGNPADRPDLFFHSSCHNHYHLRDYIQTRVWTVDGYLAWDQIRKDHPTWTAAEAFAAHPELLEEVSFAAKISFCAVDTYPMPADQGGATIPDSPKYFSCNNQGVSRGWADLYAWFQVGNWADATTFGDGPAIVEAEINTLRLFEESDYTNNRGAIPVVIAPVPSPAICGGPGC